MTCIVALVNDGVVYIAGDSLVVSVPSQYRSEVGQVVKQETKIFKKDGMLFGASGKVRMTQILRYNFSIPPYQHQDKVQYLVQEFIPTLQMRFKEDEYEVDGLTGNILLALEGELFTIGDSLNVTNTVDGYDAIGKASEVAIGSLHTTAQLDLPPLERLYLALDAAEHHTCVVSRPFTYISSEMEQTDTLPFPPYNEG